MANCVWCGDVVEGACDFVGGQPLHFDCMGEYADENADEGQFDEPWDGFMSDAEADADVLASAGYGTDEDYGSYDSDGGWEDDGRWDE